MTIMDNTDTEQNVVGFIDHPTRWQMVQCQLWESMHVQEAASSLTIHTFLDIDSSSGIYPDELIELFHGRLTGWPIQNNVSYGPISRNIRDFIGGIEDVDSESINQDLVNARHTMFVTEVNTIAKETGVTTALRYMYDELDKLLWSGHFEECDRTLSIINCHDTDLKLLIGYLTITLPWKQNLAERPPLVQQIRQVALEKLPEARVNMLLEGLT